MLSRRPKAPAFFLLTLSILALVPGAADAESFGIAGEPMDDDATAGVDLTYTHFGGDFYTTRAHLHLRTELASAKQLFFFTQGALSMAESDVADESALSNLDVGLLSRFPLTQDTRVLLRASLMLPTASDSPTEILTNQLATLTNATHLALTLPDTWALRTSGVIQSQSGSTLLRADVGFDVLLTDGPGGNDAHIGHLGGALFYLTSTEIALGAEIMNTFAVDGTLVDDDSMLSTAGLSAAFLGKRFTGKLGVFLPLDKAIRNDTNLSISMGLTWRL